MNVAIKYGAILGAKNVWNTLRNMWTSVVSDNSISMHPKLKDKLKELDKALEKHGKYEIIVDNWNEKYTVRNTQNNAKTETTIYRLIYSTPSEIKQLAKKISEELSTPIAVAEKL